jgi:CRISPR-associated protein Csh2
MIKNFKQNRVFGLVSVIAKNSSWNSDFNHSPKKYEDTYFASERALKYAVRHLLEQMGKNVLIKKWIKEINNKGIVIMNSTDLKKYIKEKFGGELHQVFWEFEDIRQFGMVYDGMGIHGPVQISQGIDKYGQGFTYQDDLTGPMEFSTKNDPSKTTRGMASREFLTEAHFVYDFSVNPKNVEFLREIKGYEHCGYSEEDFEKLIECLLYGPANVKSTQKMNCFTGFLLYIEMQDGEKTLLSNLQGKIKIEPEKVDEKVVYDINDLISYLENQQKASGNIYKKIKLIYEETEVIVKGLDRLENGQFKDLCEVECL